jgi:hypothetical protein
MSGTKIACKKSVLRGFRELELWCIVSPRVPLDGFIPAAARIRRYNTRRQRFVGNESKSNYPVDIPSGGP